MALGAKAVGISIRDEVAPLLTGGSIAVAVALFQLRERSERRRKTLEAFEKQLYDKDMRLALSTVHTALTNESYEADSEPDRPGSHRDLTSFLLNYVETCCAGVVQGFYDRRLMREFLKPTAKLLVSRFLLEPQPGTYVPTERFRKFAGEFENMRAVFPELFEPASDDETLTKPQ